MLRRFGEFIKVLRHSFVESPDMKNVYDGIVNLNENGEAVVKLPDYFETLNINFRYQLTPVGGYAPLFIKEEIKNNQFVIASANGSKDAAETTCCPDTTGSFSLRNTTRYCRTFSNYISIFPRFKDYFIVHIITSIMNYILLIIICQLYIKPSQKEEIKL